MQIRESLSTEVKTVFFDLGLRLIRHIVAHRKDAIKERNHQALKIGFSQRIQASSIWRRLSLIACRRFFMASFNIGRELWTWKAKLEERNFLCIATVVIVRSW